MQPRPDHHRRMMERRARWTRAGDRTIRLNDPSGFPSSTPWIGVPSQGFANPGYSWLGSDASIPLGHTAAEKMAAVTRALNLIAGSIAAMPWRVVRNEVERVPTPGWIDDPQLARPDGRLASISLVGWDTRLDAVSFREALITDVIMHGNAFVYVARRDASGAPYAPVFLLDPTVVECREGGYWVGSDRLPSGSIIHFRGMPPYDSNGCGSGVLEAYGHSLGLLDSTVAKAASSVTAPVPVGVIEVGSGYAVGEDEARLLRSQWEALHGGSDASVAVLNAAMTFKPLSWSNESLQLLEMADFGLKQVALAFGLDPSWLGVPSSSLTYNTTVLRGLELRGFSLLTWVRRIESVIDAELPRGTELQIVMDGLERADTESRYRAYEMAVRNGFMTVDEARYLEGWQPLQGGTDG